MQRYIDPRFRAQLRTFTKQGGDFDRMQRNRLQAHLIKEAYDQPRQEPIQIQTQTVRAMLTDITEWNVTQQTKKEIDYVQSQKNLSAFLNQLQGPTRRNIPTELSNSLSLLRAEPDPKYPETQRLQLKAQEEQEISREMLQSGQRDFEDLELYPKNERFVPYMYVLASFLDLKQSSLLARTQDCLQLVRLAFQYLQSTEFADFCELHQTAVSQVSELTLKSLVFSLRQFFKQNAKGFEPLTKNAKTYLQVKIGSHDALEQLFVTAVFWKLGGGSISFASGDVEFK